MLLQKGIFLRRVGELNLACEVYTRILEIDSSNKYAKNAVSILSGGCSFNSELKGLGPAPFVSVSNFFADSEIEDVFAKTLANREKFRPSGVGSKSPHYDPSKRDSWVWHDVGELRTRMQGLLRQQLPEYCDRLGMDCFEPGKIEVKVTNYLDGGFFRTHADNSIANGKTGRAISYLLYYHKQPKSFERGDLLLFDSDLDADVYRLSDFTRVTCAQNTLVLFPSPWYHTVQPVSLPGNRFEDGRMALGGHINYGDTHR